MTTLSPLTAPRLDRLPHVRHGFFTREGGVSTGIHASLNTGPGSRDDPGAVVENRRRVAASFGLGPDYLLSCYQIHSTICRVAEGPWVGERPEGDAMVTNRTGLALGALSADCAPVLFADPEAQVVGAAHAGWKGALDGVVGSTVHAMEALGAKASRIVAVVGPCIGPNSYEVGHEFFERFTHHDEGSDRFFRPGPSEEKHWFDLPGFVLWRLEQAGVGDAEWIGRDTCAEETLFFSNRRAVKRGEGDYGRLISAIALV